MAPPSGVKAIWDKIAAKSNDDMTVGHAENTLPSTTPSAAPASSIAEATGSSAFQPNISEDEQLNRAIKLSLQDRPGDGQHQVFNSAGPVPKSSSKLNDKSIKMILTLNNAFPPLEDPTGDTAIYIGPPRQMPEQTDKEYEFIKAHFKRVHVMQSKTLLAMGEDSKFSMTHLLNSTSSFRAERRLRKLGVLVTAEVKHGGKFQYYVDLRPPTEDEEAIILITDLTCTHGVLTWHLASQHYVLDSLLIGGHDHFSTDVFGEDSIMSILEAPERALESNGGAATSTSAQTSTEARPQSPKKIELEPEYSLLRHHSAVERLLQAINGNDPKIDSASKLWTFFAIARYFGCASHERIAGWITAWLYAGDNMNFIQNNPEVAYRIGMGIRSEVLVLDSFSILVGERALIEAYGEYRPSILNPLQKTVHGRKLEMLDDDERNRIDHAASALVKRVRETVVYRMCREMEFLHKSSAYRSLDDIVVNTPEEREIVEDAKTTIQDYVRSRVYLVLCQDQKPMPSHLEPHLHQTLDFRQVTDEAFDEVYKGLNQPMRLFTKTFWLALQQTGFDSGYSNLASMGTTGYDYETRYTRGLKALYQNDRVNGIVNIMRSTFNAKLQNVNRMLYERNSKTIGGAVGASVKKEDHSNHVESSEVIRSPTRAANSEPGTDAHLTKRRKTNDTDTARDTPLNRWAKARQEEESAVKKNLIGKSVPVQTGRKRPRSFIEAPQKYREGSAPTELADLRDGSTDALLPKDDEASSAAQPALAIRSKPAFLGRLNKHATQKTSPMNESLDEFVSKETMSYREKIEDTDSDDEEDSKIGLLTDEAGLSGVNVQTATDDESEAVDRNARTWRAWVDKREQAGIDAHATDTRRYPHPRNSVAAGRPKQHFSNTNTPGQPTTWTPVRGDFVPQASSPLRPTTSNDMPTFDSTSNGFLYPINPNYMLVEIQEAISAIASSMLYPPHLFHETGLLPTNLYDTLMCLSPNEFRYLPLWCPEGNDDGSGGVFDETPVPNLDEGSAHIESFGPGRIRRSFDQDSEMTGSEFEDIQSSEVISTVGRASKLATDGTVTVKSLASQPSTAGGDDDTVIIDSHDAAESLPEIEVGEDARGEAQDNEDNAFHDFEDDDSVSDADTLSGGGKNGLSASLKAFIANGDDASAALEPASASASTSKESKGKEKVQNYPHGLPERSRNLPFRNISKGQIDPRAEKGMESDEDYEFL
jgi:hypothetical protein